MSNDVVRETFYAYSDEHSDMEAVMRLHAVKRWHMIDTTRVQTLAEHTANVALLATTIAMSAPGTLFRPAALALAGLVHDLDESFTGDIPTHSKRFIHGLRELSDEVLPEVFKFMYQLNEHEQLLLKTCDLADGIRFIRLHGVDMTAKHAQAGLESQFSARIDMMHARWAREIYEHAIGKAMFYAYEQV